MYPFRIEKKKKKRRRKEKKEIEMILIASMNSCKAQIIIFLRDWRGGRGGSECMLRNNKDGKNFSLIKIHNRYCHRQATTTMRKESKKKKNYFLQFSLKHAYIHTNTCILIIPYIKYARHEIFFPHSIHS